MFGFPSTRAVEFRSVLQKGISFQVPRLVRGELKLESSQVLKFTVDCVGRYIEECFFGRMNAILITVP